MFYSWGGQSVAHNHMLSSNPDLYDWGQLHSLLLVEDKRCIKLVKEALKYFNMALSFLMPSKNQGKIVEDLNPAQG